MATNNSQFPTTNAILTNTFRMPAAEPGLDMGVSFNRLSFEETRKLIVFAMALENDRAPKVSDPTYEKVRDAIRTVANQIGKFPALDILKSHGVMRVVDLRVDQYDWVIEQCAAVLRGAALTRDPFDELQDRIDATPFVDRPQPVAPTPRNRFSELDLDNG